MTIKTYLPKIYQERSYYLKVWHSKITINSRFNYYFEDAFQDVIIRIMEANIKFESYKDVRSYITKSLLNYIVDLFRSKKKNVRLEELSTIYNLSEVKDNNNFELIKLIWKDKDFNKSAYYQIAYLRYYEDMSYKEISEELNMTLQSVKSKLFRFREDWIPKLVEKYISLA